MEFALLYGAPTLADQLCTCVLAADVLLADGATRCAWAPGIPVARTHVEAVGSRQTNMGALIDAEALVAYDLTHVQCR